MQKVKNKFKVVLAIAASAFVLFAGIILPNNVHGAAAISLHSSEKVETTLPDDITLEELKSMYLELASKYNALIDENADLASQLATLQAELNDMKNQNAELEAEIAEVISQRDGLCDTIMALEQEIDKVEAERDEYYEQIQSLEMNVNGYKEDAQYWNAKYNEALNNYNNAETTISSLENQLLAANNNIESLELEISRMRAEAEDLSVLTTRVEKLEAEVVDLTAALEASDAAYQAKVEELEAAEKALDENAEDYEAAIKHLEAEKATLEELNGQEKIELQKEVTRLTNEKAAIQAELDALRMQQEEPIKTPGVSTSWFRQNVGWVIAGSLLVCAALFIIVPKAEGAF